MADPTGANPGAGNDPGETWEGLDGGDRHPLGRVLLGSSIFENGTQLSRLAEVTTPALMRRDLMIRYLDDRRAGIYHLARPTDLLVVECPAR